MSARQAFEQLAERGTPRGADAVLRAARSGSVADVHGGRRWPVRVVLVGVAAVFVLIVAVALRGGNEDSQPVDTGPGYLFGQPTDTTLLINTGVGSLVALDLDSGLAQQYGGLDVAPTGTQQGIIASVSDRIVYQGETGTNSLPPDLVGPPSEIGPSGGFIPSGAPDRVWLYGGERVEERTIDGEVTVPLTPFPSGDGGPALPVLGVDDLLALVSSPTRYWEPSTGRRFGPTDGSLEEAVTAARGSTVVVGWPRAIEQPGRATSVSVEPGLDVTEAAISPDESTVAAWDVGGGAPTRGGSLVLIDAATGQWRRLDGTSGAEGASVTWSEDGRWVFVLSRGAADAEVPGVRVTAYELGTERGATVEIPSLLGGEAVAVPRAMGPALSSAGTAECPAPETYPPTTGGFVPVPGAPEGTVTEAPPAVVPITVDRACAVRTIRHIR